MLQTENIRGLAIVRSPQQRLASLAFVAAIHIAVIVALIAAFMPRTFPVVGPIIVHFVPPKSDTTQQPQHPIGQPKLINPTAPPIPVPPHWNEKDTTLQQITPPPSGAQGNAQMLPTRSPVALFSTHSTPPYPALELRLGTEGNVLLKLTIDADGGVTDAEVVRSSGHDDLDQAAARWVKAHWRYLPALQNGIAVSSSTEAVVTFRLTSH